MLVTASKNADFLFVVVVVVVAVDFGSGGLLVKICLRGPKVRNKWKIILANERSCKNFIPRFKIYEISYFHP